MKLKKELKRERKKKHEHSAYGPPVGTEYVAPMNWSSLASAISLLYILAIEAFVLVLHNVQSMIYTSSKGRRVQDLQYRILVWIMDCKLCRAKINASNASMYSKLMAEDRFMSATYSLSAYWW